MASVFKSDSPWGPRLGTLTNWNAWVHQELRCPMRENRWDLERLETRKPIWPASRGALAASYCAN